MNIFMNFVKKSLMGGETKGGVGASKEIRALLLLALDFLARPWVPVSLSYSIELTKKLTQGLRWVVQDLEAIAIEGLNVILSNGLADPLGMELLEL